MSEILSALLWVIILILIILVMFRDTIDYEDELDREKSNLTFNSVPAIQFAGLVLIFTLFTYGILA